MDRVERGIDEMLHYLEEFIKNQGLADMVASANIIITVSDWHKHVLYYLTFQFASWNFVADKYVKRRK